MAFNYNKEIYCQLALKIIFTLLRPANGLHKYFFSRNFAFFPRWRFFVFTLFRATTRDKRQCQREKSDPQSDSRRILSRFGPSALEEFCDLPSAYSTDCVKWDIWIINLFSTSQRLFTSSFFPPMLAFHFVTHWFSYQPRESFTITFSFNIFSSFVLRFLIRDFFEFFFHRVLHYSPRFSEFFCTFSNDATKQLQLFRFFYTISILIIFFPLHKYEKRLKRMLFPTRLNGKWERFTEVARIFSLLKLFEHWNFP